MELVEKLRRLVAREFPGADVDVDVIPGAVRVAGIVTWHGFGDLDHIDRQDKLWGVVKAGLTAEEIGSISFLLAMTPEELAANRE